MNNNMKLWHRLNIDTTDAIRPEWKFTPPLLKPLNVQFVKSQQIFNDKWLQYVDSLGLKIVSALVFYRAPYANAPTAHVDLTNLGQVRFASFGINWTIGGAGSEMVWYDKPASLNLDDVKYTEANNAFMDWPFEELTEINRVEIGTKATLVRVDYPHTVSMQAEPRWCISARTTIRDDLPWATITSLLRSKNLILED